MPQKSYVDTTTLTIFVSAAFKPVEGQKEARGLLQMSPRIPFRYLELLEPRRRNLDLRFRWAASQLYARQSTRLLVKIRGFCQLKLSRLSNSGGDRTMVGFQHGPQTAD
jgi:hypothetical protein